MIRTLVVDDQALVRGGFASILSDEPDIDVVGEAADGRQAVAACAELRPDVVLMDVRMPVMDGIEATRLITAHSAIKVLVLTTFDADEHVYDAITAGAGYAIGNPSWGSFVDGRRLIGIFARSSWRNEECCLSAHEFGVVQRG